MTRLTRKEERWLRWSATLVRMYIATLTIVAPYLCFKAAGYKYGLIAQVGRDPEIPEIATWGNIIGIYLPLWAVVAAYVWATRPAPDRNLAPNGFAMGLFRDMLTVVVLTVLLLVPYGWYGQNGTLQSAHGYMVWYQTVLTGLVGTAFTYYFHGRISTEKPGEDSAAAPAAVPKRKAPRRRPKQAPAAQQPTTVPEPASAAQTVEA
jgi:hypothetical protein